MAWTCVLCTFINLVPDSLVCDVCQTPKPQPPAVTPRRLLADSHTCEVQSTPMVLPPPSSRIHTIRVGEGTYIGDTQHGVPHGQGLLIIGNETWEGEFETGRLAKGTYTNKRGTTEYGTFDRDGQLTGTGFRCNKKGESYNGNFENGVSNGDGVSKDANGDTTHEGQWLDGEPVTKVFFFFSNRVHP